MPKTVAILQSNYIPWKGYFDIIGMVDEFIFYDDLQFTKNDWRNRNKIKTPKGAEWITIPCGTNTDRLICEVALHDHTWQRKHWTSISVNYAKASYWNEYKPFFEEIYLGKQWTNLSELNTHIIRKISTEVFKFKTEFQDSRQFQLSEKKGDRVIELLKKTQATKYVSGPAAKDYISDEVFIKNGIEIQWMDYSHYQEYHQLYPPFEHAVSIIDLIFNEGPNAKRFLKCNAQ